MLLSVSDFYSFFISNSGYNEKDNYYICPMGQHMRFVRQERRKSDTGYVSTISIYQAERCDGCPLRCKCHKSKNNRVIEVNHILNQYKTQIRELLNSPTGLYHRSKRPIEPESVFGHINPNFPLEPSRRNVKLKANRFIPKFSNPCSSIHLKSHFHDYFVRVLFNICWNSKHFIAYCR